MNRKTVFILHPSGPEGDLLARAFPDSLWTVHWLHRAQDLGEETAGPDLPDLMVADARLASDVAVFPPCPRLILQRRGGPARGPDPYATVLSWPCPVKPLMDAIRILLPPPDAPATAPPPPSMIGTSPAVQRLYHQITAAARSDAPVFITGETGTGKDLCAQTLHRLSPRRGAPFVPINCAAIPRDLMESELFGHVRGAFTGATGDREGAISQAHGGVLFLDEVGDLPLPLQAKLLRFLQDFQYCPVGSSAPRTARVRIVCATNHDPMSLVSRGAFRADLYYRLHVIALHLPPLRDRGADIEALALHFLTQFSQQEGKKFAAFAPETIALLRHHAWPGNIRQLQNALRHAVVFHEGPVLHATMLPGSLFTGPTAQPGEGCGDFLSPANRTSSDISPLWLAEKRAIEHAVTRCAGNIQLAAQRLGIAPSTIYRKRMAWTGAEREGTPGPSRTRRAGES